MAKILLVDDDIGVIASVKAVLGSKHEIIAAKDLETGKRLFLTKQPDVAIIDHTFPDTDGGTQGFNGVVMIDSIRQGNWKNTPIISLSATNTGKDTGDGKLSAEKGANIILSKPFDLSELRSAVEECVAMRARSGGAGS